MEGRMELEKKQEKQIIAAKQRNPSRNMRMKPT